MQPLSLVAPDQFCSERNESPESLIPGLIVLPSNNGQEFTPCFVMDFDADRCLLRVDLSYTLCQRDVLIRILDRNDDQRIELVGRITDSLQHTIDTTTFECRFGQKLPPHVLAMMEQMSFVDRRKAERSQCMVRVNVCRIQRGKVISQASMVEASDEGLRMRTEVPLDIGEQVIVQLPNGEDILVAIVWSKEVNGINQTGGTIAKPCAETSILHSVHRLAQS